MPTMTKEQLEKLRMLVEFHNEDNDELGQAARELLPVLDSLHAEPPAPLGRVFDLTAELRCYFESGTLDEASDLYLLLREVEAMQPSVNRP